MLNKLQNLFVQISSKIENSPVPISQYYFFFIAILAVRLALEFFSSHRLFSFDDVIHISLWFTFIVLAFMLQLQLFSKEKMVKIAKLVITCFTIALTAPIIDLIVSGGVGAKMNYLSLNSWQDVLWSYLTVGGASLLRGATLGIRIEILLLLIACFNYVRTKRNSIWKGLIAAWSVYTVLFISGAVPLILGFMVNTFHLQYQNDDQSTLLFLLSIDLMLLFLILLRHSKEVMKEILKIVSWELVAIGVLQFVIGMGLALKLYPDNFTLNPTSLFWFPLWLALGLCFAAYTSAQKKDKYSVFTIPLLLLISLISVMISPKVLFVAAASWGILFFLKEPPLYLYKVPLLRDLLVGMLGVAFALMGFVSFGAPMVGLPALWIACLGASGFLFSLCISIWFSKTNFPYSLFLIPFYVVLAYFAWT